jgi:hypothetical protein
MRSLILLMLLALSAPAAATNTPEHLAGRYFSALQNGDYVQAAELFEPAGLTEFRRMMDFHEQLPAESQTGFLQSFFGPDASAKSVRQLSDAEFFAALLRSVMRQAEAVGTLSFDSLEVLGGVEEGAEVIHLVTRNRISMGAVDMETMEVLSLRRTESGWRILMSGKLRGLPAQLQSLFKQAKGKPVQP